MLIAPVSSFCAPLMRAIRALILRSAQDQPETVVNDEDILADVRKILTHILNRLVAARSFVNSQTEQNLSDACTALSRWSRPAMSFKQTSVWISPPPMGPGYKA